MVIGTITRESVHNVSGVFHIVVLTLINSGIQEWHPGRAGQAYQVTHLIVIMVV